MRSSLVILQRTLVALDDKLKGSSLVGVGSRGVGADNGLAILLDKLGDNARGDIHAQGLTVLQLECELAGVRGHLVNALELEVDKGVGVQSRGDGLLGDNSGSLDLRGSSRSSQLVTIVGIRSYIFDKNQ